MCAFTKTETKDTFKSTSKMDLNLINNSDSASTNNSKEDFNNIFTASKCENVNNNNNFVQFINKKQNNEISKNQNQNFNNFNFLNSKACNSSNKFGNINLKNHSTFNSNYNNLFPNLTTNSFNNIKENNKLFGISENCNNINNKNFSNNLFSDKFQNMKGIFNKEQNKEKQKDRKTKDDFLNKKTQRDNVLLRKETDNSLLDSNITTYSHVNLYFLNQKNNKSVEVSDAKNNKNCATNKTIFRTIKNHNKLGHKVHNKAVNFEKEINSSVDMRKMMKLMKNRLSARKCRQKKKHYIKNLEKEIHDLREELNKYKSIQTNEMKLEYYIDQVN